MLSTRPAPNFLCLLWLLIFYSLSNAPAAPLPSPDSPTAFFNTVSSHLLRSELNLRLHRIQIHPKNEYTPAVHRLLQLTANLLDSATNRFATGYPHLPTVFRPLFTNEAGVIYITGYQEETGTAAATAPVRDLAEPADRAALQPTDLVFGIPLIIGARKGFPNFNEFAMQTEFHVTRRLEFRRPALASAVNETNQMYLVGISNVFAVEAWNSYTNSFPRPLDLAVAIEMTAVVTNEFGVLFTNRISAANLTNIPGTTWAGYYGPQSFQIPLSNHVSFLPAATYHEQTRSFIPSTNAFERGLGFPVPRWWLSVHTRLRFILIDSAAQRIVDYVHLSAFEPSIAITDKLTEDGDCQTLSANPASQWCTNRIQNASTVFAPTYGILNQLNSGFGNPLPNDWNSFRLDPTAGSDAMKAIDWFRFNMGLTPRYFPGQTYYKSNIFYAPLIPLRGIYKQVRWQANDPLVHHLISDLQVEQPVGFFGEYPALPNILRPNNRYEPWAYLPRSSSTRFDPTLKDPLVSRSDDWNFPENQSLGGHWLGSVHRGTPWQSIYLKSAAVNAARWQNWLGYIDDAEAQHLHPTNDWRIAGIITSLFNTNPPLHLVSVNNEDLATWTETLGGVEVLTNTISDADLAGDPFLSPQFDLLIMQPTSPQSSTIAAAINNTRTSLPGQRFRDLGQILATPQLAFASPWLNTGTNQVLLAINDQAYEKIPSQILSRLRADSLASITDVGDAVQVEFSGVDGYPYAVQTSTNMVDWTSVSTNYPTNGSFNLIEHPPAPPAARYYRSVLLP